MPDTARGPRAARTPDPPVTRTVRPDRRSENRPRPRTGRSSFRAGARTNPRPFGRPGAATRKPRSRADHPTARIVVIHRGCPQPDDQAVDPPPPIRRSPTASDGDRTARPTRRPAGSLDLITRSEHLRKPRFPGPPGLWSRLPSSVFRAVMDEFLLPPEGPAQGPGGKKFMIFSAVHSGPGVIPNSPAVVHGFMHKLINNLWTNGVQAGGAAATASASRRTRRALRQVSAPTSRSDQPRPSSSAISAG